jgi:hypothetical protein
VQGNTPREARCPHRPAAPGLLLRLQKRWTKAPKAEGKEGKAEVTAKIVVHADARVSSRKGALKLA